MFKKVLTGFVLLAVAALVVTSLIRIFGERTATWTIQEKIEKASKKQLALIQSALDDEMEITRALAIKSGRHKLAYYVGANIYGRGV